MEPREKVGKGTTDVQRLALKGNQGIDDPGGDITALRLSSSRGHLFSIGRWLDTLTLFYVLPITLLGGWDAHCTDGNSKT